MTGNALYDLMPAWAQTRLLGIRGRQLRRRRFGEGYEQMRALLRRTERSSPEELREVQAGFLRRLVARAAAEVPYYREVFARERVSPEEIRTASDLRRLPILSKETVRARKEELVSDAVPRRRLLPGHTSGTTGASLTLYWDENVDVVTNAVLWRHREWANVPFGTPYATLLGNVIVPLSRSRGPLWRWNRPWNQLLLSSFHMREETLDAYVKQMREAGIAALEAYPSTAYVLARYLEARGEVLPLRAVFTSAETLLRIQREVIEERFACRVFDYLGAAERVVFAGECEEHQGLHLFEEYGVTEVVDERGEPVPDGGVGRLVVTGLHNFAMPLLRYEIGDVSGIRRESCPCGRPLPLLHPVTTKAEDVVVLPDGRFISPSALTHPFKPLRSIAESQIVQEAPDLIRVLIVPRADYDRTRDGAKLLAALHERLGEGVTVRLEEVASIPRGPVGKFRWVVSRLPLRFGPRQTENLYAALGEPPKPTP